MDFDDMFSGEGAGGEAGTGGDSIADDLFMFTGMNA